MLAARRRQALALLNRQARNRQQGAASVARLRTGPVLRRWQSSATAQPNLRKESQPDHGADVYLLPRNKFEQMRLNFQHTVITRQFGGLLPRSVTFAPEDQILDVGCGTGIWALNLAATVPPTVTIHSTDISPANFPLPSHPIPSNVHFSAPCPIFSLPQSWTKKFSVTHQRLFSACLTTTQWRAALAEHYRVLRPGGMVILTEIDGEPFKGRHAEACPAQAEITKLLKGLYEKKDMIFDMQGVLPGLVEDSGFEILECEAKVFSAEGAVVGRRKGRLEDDTLANTINTFETFWGVVERMGLVDEETYRGWLREVKESWRGAEKTREGRGNTWVRICARKPVS